MNKYIILISFLLISFSCTDISKNNIGEEGYSCFKDGTCSENLFCNGTKCIDLCKDKVCNDWESCYFETGFCDPKSERCNQDKDCKDKVCNLSTHYCYSETSCENRMCPENSTCQESQNYKCICDNNYHSEISGCVLNSKNVVCNSSSIPKNSVADKKEVEIHWVNDSWEEVPSCSWSCDIGYEEYEKKYCYASSIYQFGTSKNDIAKSMVSDNNGNFYIIGYTTGAFEGENKGDFDVFITKISNNEIKWSKQFGTTSKDYGHSIAIDDDALYITGVSEGDIILNDGVTAGAFIMKLSLDGEKIWEKQFKDFRIFNNSSLSIKNKHIYLTASQENENGIFELLLFKFEMDGNIVWRKTHYGGSDLINSGIAVDNYENIYLTGYYDNNVGNKHDIYVVKYNKDGNYEWRKEFGSNKNDNGVSIIVKDHVYITGYVSESLNGNTYYGATDVFLLKINKNDGKLLWSKVLGSLGDDSSTSIVSSYDGYIYITGYVYGKIGSEIAYLGGKDLFLSKFTLDGKEVWSKIWGTESDDKVNYLFLNRVDFNNDGTPDNIIYLLGETEGTLKEYNKGLKDIFLMKLNFE